MIKLSGTQFFAALMLAFGLMVGEVDAIDFRPLIDHPVRQLIVEPDGRILLQGRHIATVNGGVCQRLCRLTGEGQLDPNFQTPYIRGELRVVRRLPDGRLLLGLSRDATVNGRSLGMLARLHPDGSIDETFQDVRVFYHRRLQQLMDLAVDTEGRIYAVGEFSHINGMLRRNVVRLTPDGALDFSFDAETALPPDPDLRGISLEGVRIQSDGRVLIFGEQPGADGLNKDPLLIRLNTDGSLDPTFSVAFGPITSSFILRDLQMLPGGSMLLAGRFPQDGENALRNLVRLHSDGTLDNGFSADFDEQVRTVRPLNDGSLLVGGLFTEVNGQPARAVARLQANGSLHSGFSSPIQVEGSMTTTDPTVEALDEMPMPLPMTWSEALLSIVRAGC